MTKSQKEWIDNASYQQLLEKWRNASIGDAILIGETGKYFNKVIAEKRKQIDDEEIMEEAKEEGIDIKENHSIFAGRWEENGPT